MASLIKSPISRSLFAEIVATCAISSLVLMGFDISSISLTTCCAAAWMPLLRSEGFMPAATAFTPSAKIALVRTVAVVVPVAVDTPLTPVVAVLAETDRLEAAALKDAVVDVAPSRDEM